MACAASVPTVTSDPHVASQSSTSSKPSSHKPGFLSVFLWCFCPLADSYPQSFHLPQAPPLPSLCPFPSPIEGRVHCGEPLRDMIKLTFVAHRGFHYEQGGVCHLIFVVVNMCNWGLLREASFGQVICSFCNRAWRFHPLWCYVLFVWEILNNYVVGECAS